MGLMKNARLYKFVFFSHARLINLFPLNSFRENCLFLFHDGSCTKRIRWKIYPKKTITTFDEI